MGSRGWLRRQELAECEDEEELQALVDEYIQNDFEQRIGWALSDGYPTLKKRERDA